MPTVYSPELDTMVGVRWDVILNLDKKCSFMELPFREGKHKIQEFITRTQNMT